MLRRARRRQSRKPGRWVFGAHLAAISTLFTVWFVTLKCTTTLTFPPCFAASLHSGRVNLIYNPSLPSAFGYKLYFTHTSPDWLFDWSFYPTWWFVRIPLWPLIAAVVLSLAWFIHLRLRHRPGTCRSCGYALRGLKGTQSGMIVCPECGHEQPTIHPESSKSVGP